MSDKKMDAWAKKMLDGAIKNMRIERFAELFFPRDGFSYFRFWLTWEENKSAVCYGLDINMRSWGKDHYEALMGLESMLKAEITLIRQHGMNAWKTASQKTFDKSKENGEIVISLGVNIDALSEGDKRGSDGSRSRRARRGNRTGASGGRVVPKGKKVRKGKNPR